MIKMRMKNNKKVTARQQMIKIKIKIKMRMKSNKKVTARQQNGAAGLCPC